MSAADDVRTLEASVAALQARRADGKALLKEIQREQVEARSAGDGAGVHRALAELTALRDEQVKVEAELSAAQARLRSARRAEADAEGPKAPAYEAEAAQHAAALHEALLVAGQELRALAAKVEGARARAQAARSRASGTHVDLTHELHPDYPGQREAVDALANYGQPQRRAFAVGAGVR